MNRRQVLASASLGLSPATAGCTVLAQTELTLSLISRNDDLDVLSFDIAVVEDTVSDDEFPTLEISVENVGEETATWEQAGNDFAFPGRSVTGTGGGLVIGLEDEIETRLLEGGGCARVERGIDRDDVLVTTNLEPGESIEQRYGIAGSDYELDERCPEPGSYRATSKYGDHGSWAFRFELEE
ncbi:hypothetical protein CV102_19770 [Natronococcus pandeyae]|uniref:DUF8130 domain-containing protein n=1 Tax=Natronococcus pandeyae TaxID=2055836 RepID=A0A8J8Q0D5_9EURY|nr:hypothetical protein [Natronococcus pandeyae]TYL36992.1 hypothetical protein CV102_19770 [Natronococcus pandeyae]